MLGIYFISGNVIGRKKSTFVGYKTLCSDAILLLCNFDLSVEISKFVVIKKKTSYRKKIKIVVGCFGIYV